MSAEMPIRPKVIQIVCALCYEGEEIPSTESLYALDSFGRIWEFRKADRRYTSGWVELDLPWNNLQELKEAAIDDSDGGDQ
jgi:hypothetical protein